MGVLEKLRIQPEPDEEFRSEPDENYEAESDAEPNENWDPEPGEAPARATTRPKAKLAQLKEAAPRITKKMRDDAQSEIESMLLVAALGWSWQAPPCGDALEAAAPDIAEKLTKIIARNPRWLQRVRDGGLIADVLQLCGVLAPVAKVAYGYYTQPREAGDGNGVEFDPSQFVPYDGSGFSRAG